MKYNNRNLSPHVHRNFSSKYVGKIVMLNDVARYISETTYDNETLAEQDRSFKGIKIAKRKASDSYGNLTDVYKVLEKLYSGMPKAAYDGKITVFASEHSEFAKLNIEGALPSSPMGTVTTGLMISEKDMETLVHEELMFATLKDDDDKIEAVKTIRLYMAEAFKFLPDYQDTGLVVVNAPVDTTKIKHSFNERAKAALRQDEEYENRMSRQAQIDAVTREALMHESRTARVLKGGYNGLG